MVSTIETIRDYTGPMPDLVESGIVEAIRAFFVAEQPNRLRDPMLKNYVWTQDVTETDLWINTYDYFNEHNVAKRPAVNVKVGDMAPDPLLLNNGLVWGKVNDDYTYNTLFGKMPFFIACRDTAKKVASKLSGALGVRLQQGSLNLKDQLMLNSIEIKKVTATKKTETDDFKASVRGIVTTQYTFKQ